MRNRKASVRQPRRYQILRKELTRLIRKGEPGDPLPSYTEMIRAYGIGQATIDRVIREFDQAGLIVRQAGKGIFISQRAGKKTIGLVFGRNIFGAGLSPITSILIQRCRERAAAKKQNFKFYLDISSASGDANDIPFHEQLAEDIRARRLDGVILVWSHGTKEVEWLQTHKIPVVSMEQFEGTTNSVTVDYLDLLRKGTLALATKGCKRIALLSPFGYLRKDGYHRDVEEFRDALRGYGLEAGDDLVLDDRTDSSVDAGGPLSHEEMGFRILDRVLAGGVVPQSLPFDGIVSLDDMLTRGALTRLRSSQIQIGAQVHIATHANKGSPALQGEERNLVLLQVDPDEIVEAMFSVLEPVMTGKSVRPSQIMVMAKIEAAAAR